MKGQDTPSNDHPQSALVAFFFSENSLHVQPRHPVRSSKEPMSCQLQGLMPEILGHVVLCYCRQLGSRRTPVIIQEHLISPGPASCMKQNTLPSFDTISHVDWETSKVGTV